MTTSREYLSDEMQKCIDTLFKTLPTGEKCNTNYYRFYKTDITGGTGDCMRFPVTVCPSSTGGASRAGCGLTAAGGFGLTATF